MRAALITCGILALAAALLALPAAAQSTEAEARALFEEGVALYDRGELDGAEDRFRRSLALRPASSVRYNLAAVLADTGRLAEARELYLVVAGDVRAPAEVRRTSRDNARELHERLARLTVELAGETRGVVVRLDDRELEGPGPHLVDPGMHVLVAERAGTRVFRRELSLGEREQHTVAVLATLPDARQPSLSSEPPPPELVSEWWLWTLVGLAVAAVTAGGILIGFAIDEGRYFSGNIGPGRIVID